MNTSRSTLFPEQLPLLSQAEQEQMRRTWNATQVTFPQIHVLHQLVEEQCARTPDTIAVLYEGTPLTYRQLNQRANQLAHFLRARGVQLEQLIGIAMERSLELIIGLLGILKAGGAYVPLDPTHPRERLEYMLEDAQATFVLTQEHLSERLPLTQAIHICLDSAWPQIECYPSDNPVHVVQPGHLSYMIYTSGSTGKPKGALNTHRGICNRLLWMQKEYPLYAQDHVLQKTPYSFDVSVWELFWPLITGACLVVARPEGHKDPAYIADVIKRESISVVHFVPSMLQAFLNEPDIELCTSLRRIICSGEALSYPLQERCFARLKAQLHNLYGPTETAVEVTAWLCERESRLRTVPIGYPIANTQMHILDEHLQPVPLGSAGELHIGGVQVGRGYWRRPELTAEKFIRDPFSPDSSARLYKTGDIARYLPDGAIEYLGRMDHQVKINGVRIEVGEIENALLSHPQVREAVVVPRQHDAGGQRLIAYLVSSTERRPSLSEIRDSMRQRLPAYMVPAHFVFLPSLPLTFNGKLDRLALPVPAEADIRDETPLALPQTTMEVQIADIWQTVLGIKQIGIHDSFFDLGGNSLLATQIVLRVREAFHVTIALHDVFRAPTVAQLTVFVAQQQARTTPRLSTLKQEIDEETAQNVLADFSSLSEEEVDALYQQILEGNTHGNHR